jgi:hypothetical protein
MEDVLDLRDSEKGPDFDEEHVQCRRRRHRVSLVGKRNIPQQRPEQCTGNWGGRVGER